MISANHFGTCDLHLKLEVSDLPDAGCYEEFRFRVDAIGWSDGFDPSAGGDSTDFVPVEDDPRAGYVSIEDFPSSWPPAGTNPDGLPTAEPFPRVTQSFRVTYKYDGDTLTANGGDELLESSETNMVCWQSATEARVRECYSRITLQRTSITSVKATYEVDHHFDAYYLNGNGQATGKIQTDLNNPNPDWMDPNSTCHKKLTAYGSISGERCPKNDHSECNQ